MSFEEKRKSLRIPITAKVQVIKGDEEGIFFTENFSRGGFQINMEQPPFVGTAVRVEISLPNTDSLLEAKCEVVWRQEGLGCGVKIRQITKANQAILDDFLAKQSKS
ncbi:MAG: PilZ domain-containing protein [Bdellovibrionota bacterium]